MKNSLLKLDRNIASTRERVSSNLVCLFTSEEKIGWDIYQDQDGSLFSISTTSPSGDSHFGTINHVLKLMSCGYFSGSVATDAGLEALSGICTPLPSDYMDKVDVYARLRENSNTWRFSVKRNPPEFAYPTLGKEVNQNVIQSSWLPKQFRGEATSA